MMIRSLLLACALFAAGSRAACTVNTPNDLGINPTCKDELLPYCRNNAPPTDTPSFVCVACNTDCDCDLGWFCSSEPGSVGECKEFTDKLGKECLPYSPADLRNTDLDDDLKCAITYTRDIGGGVTGTFVDKAGACFNKICRFCDFEENTSSNTSAGCGYTAGSKAGRTCVYPGEMSFKRQANWAPGSYHRNVDAVFWVTFWCFFMLLAACQLAQTIKMFM
jgi:hypothetical protein